MDLDGSCRICAGIADPGVSLLDPGQQKLAKWTLNHLGMTVSRDSGYPTRVCIQCIQSIRSWMVFREKCTKASRLFAEKTGENAASSGSPLQQDLSSKKPLISFEQSSTSENIITVSPAKSLGQESPSITKPPGPASSKETVPITSQIKEKSMKTTLMDWLINKKTTKNVQKPSENKSTVVAPSVTITQECSNTSTVNLLRQVRVLPANKESSPISRGVVDVTSQSIETITIPPSPIKVENGSPYAKYSIKELRINISRLTENFLHNLNQMKTEPIVKKEKRVTFNLPDNFSDSETGTEDEMVPEKNKPGPKSRKIKSVTTTSKIKSILKMRPTSHETRNSLQSQTSSPRMHLSDDSNTASNPSEDIPTEEFSEQEQKFKPLELYDSEVEIVSEKSKPGPKSRKMRSVTTIQKTMPSSEQSYTTTSSTHKSDDSTHESNNFNVANNLGGILAQEASEEEEKFRPTEFPDSEMGTEVETVYERSKPGPKSRKMRSVTTTSKTMPSPELSYTTTSSTDESDDLNVANNPPGDILGQKSSEEEEKFRPTEFPESEMGTEVETVYERSKPGPKSRKIRCGATITKAKPSSEQNDTSICKSDDGNTSDNHSNELPSQASSEEEEKFISPEFSDSEVGTEIVPERRKPGPKSRKMKSLTAISKTKLSSRETRSFEQSYTSTTSTHETDDDMTDSHSNDLSLRNPSEEDKTMSREPLVEIEQLILPTTFVSAEVNKITKSPVEMYKEIEEALLLSEQEAREVQVEPATCSATEKMKRIRTALSAELRRRSFGKQNVTAVSSTSKNHEDILIRPRRNSPESFRHVDSTTVSPEPEIIVPKTEIDPPSPQHNQNQIIPVQTVPLQTFKPEISQVPPTANVPSVLQQTSTTNIPELPPEIRSCYARDQPVTIIPMEHNGKTYFVVNPITLPTQAPSISPSFPPINQVNPAPLASVPSFTSALTDDVEVKDSQVVSAPLQQTPAMPAEKVPDVRSTDNLDLYENNKVSSEPTSEDKSVVPTSVQASEEVLGMAPECSVDEDATEMFENGVVSDNEDDKETTDKTSTNQIQNVDLSVEILNKVPENCTETSTKVVQDQVEIVTNDDKASTNEIEAVEEGDRISTNDATDNGDLTVNDSHKNSDEPASTVLPKVTQPSDLLKLSQAAMKNLGLTFEDSIPPRGTKSIQNKQNQITPTQTCIIDPSNQSVRPIETDVNTECQIPSTCNVNSKTQQVVDENVLEKRQSYNRKAAQYALQQIQTGSEILCSEDEEDVDDTAVDPDYSSSDEKSENRVTTSHNVSLKQNSLSSVTSTSSVVYNVPSLKILAKQALLKNTSCNKQVVGSKVVTSSPNSRMSVSSLFTTQVNELQRGIIDSDSINTMTNIDPTPNVISNTVTQQSIQTGNVGGVNVNERPTVTSNQVIIQGQTTISKTQLPPFYNLSYNEQIETLNSRRRNIRSFDRDDEQILSRVSMTSCVVCKKLVITSMLSKHACFLPESVQNISSQEIAPINLTKKKKSPTQDTQTAAVIGSASPTKLPDDLASFVLENESASVSTTKSVATPIEAEPLKEIPAYPHPLSDEALLNFSVPEDNPELPDVPEIDTEIFKEPEDSDTSDDFEMSFEEVKDVPTLQCSKCDQVFHDHKAFVNHYAKHFYAATAIRVKRKKKLIKKKKVFLNKKKILACRNKYLRITRSITKMETKDTEPSQIDADIQNLLDVNLPEADDVTIQQVTMYSSVEKLFNDLQETEQENGVDNPAIAKSTENKDNVQFDFVKCELTENVKKQLSDIEKTQADTTEVEAGIVEDGEQRGGKSKTKKKKDLVEMCEESTRSLRSHSSKPKDIPISLRKQKAEKKPKKVTVGNKMKILRHKKENARKLKLLLQRKKLQGNTSGELDVPDAGTAELEPRKTRRQSEQMKGNADDNQDTNKNSETEKNEEESIVTETQGRIMESTSKPDKGDEETSESREKEVETKLKKTRRRGKKTKGISQSNENNDTSVTEEKVPPMKTRGKSKKVNDNSLSTVSEETRDKSEPDAKKTRGRGKKIQDTTEKMNDKCVAGKKSDVKEKEVQLKLNKTRGFQKTTRKSKQLKENDDNAVPEENVDELQSKKAVDKETLMPDANQEAELQKKSESAPKKPRGRKGKLKETRQVESNKYKSSELQTKEQLQKTRGKKRKITEPDVTRTRGTNKKLKETTSDKNKEMEETPEPSENELVGKKSKGKGKKLIQNSKVEESPKNVTENSNIDDSDEEVDEAARIQTMKQAYKLHVKNHYAYSCPKCPSRFKNRQKLYIHLKNHGINIDLTNKINLEILYEMASTSKSNIYDEFSSLDNLNQSIYSEPDELNSSFTSLRNDEELQDTDEQMDNFDESMLSVDEPTLQNVGVPQDVPNTDNEESKNDVSDNESSETKLQNTDARLSQEEMKNKISENTDKPNINNTKATEQNTEVSNNIETIVTANESINNSQSNIEMFVENNIEDSEPTIVSPAKVSKDKNIETEMDTIKEVQNIATSDEVGKETESSSNPEINIDTKETPHLEIKSSNNEILTSSNIKPNNNSISNIEVKDIEIPFESSVDIQSEEEGDGVCNKSVVTVCNKCNEALDAVSFCGHVCALREPSQVITDITAVHEMAVSVVAELDNSDEIADSQVVSVFQEQLIVAAHGHSETPKPSEISEGNNADKVESTVGKNSSSESPRIQKSDEKGQKSTPCVSSSMQATPSIKAGVIEVRSQKPRTVEQAESLDPPEIIKPRNLRGRKVATVTSKKAVKSSTSSKTAQDSSPSKSEVSKQTTKESTKKSPTKKDITSIESLLSDKSRKGLEASHAPEKTESGVTDLLPDIEPPESVKLQTPNLRKRKLTESLSISKQNRKLNQKLETSIEKSLDKGEAPEKPKTTTLRKRNIISPNSKKTHNSGVSTKKLLDDAQSKLNTSEITTELESSVQSPAKKQKIILQSADRKKSPEANKSLEDSLTNSSDLAELLPRLRNTKSRISELKVDSPSKRNVPRKKSSLTKCSACNKVVPDVDKHECVKKKTKGVVTKQTKKSKK